MKIKHLVMYSGGVCSWAAAKRVAEKYGTEEMVLLFADTKIEDPTLYEFIESSSINIGAKLVKIEDGRTPFEVFRDRKFLGNSRIDPCSDILKRKLLNKWRKENCDPSYCVTYFGLDWNEPHRLKKVRERHKPWVVEAPMCEKPIMVKEKMLEWCRSEGLTPCKLYDLGFSHANCGGGCVKSGVAQFRHLYKTKPEVFKRWVEEEEKLRLQLGDVSILTRMKNGKKSNLTLLQLKEEIDSNTQLSFDELMDWGGCGCAVD